MKAEIFYQVLPHTSEANEEVKKLYWVMMGYGDKNKANVVIKKGLWATYWRRLPLTEDIDTNIPINQELERIFAKYNTDGNPYYAKQSNWEDVIHYDWRNDPKQIMLRESGARHTSMSVGDVIKVDGTYYRVASAGFQKILVR